MTPKKQHIAILKVCGWTEEEPWNNGTRCFAYKDSLEGWRFEDLPNFLNDLNAMHEAEDALDSNQWEIWHRIVGDWTTNKAHLTAAQRAEAFLRTLKLWEETP